MSATRRPSTATTEPRSEGMVTRSPRGAERATSARKRPISSTGMSSMKKLGALAGMVVRIWPARLLSITARVVNRVRPRPSATTSRPVWAPGRWRLASAIRNTGCLGRGSREAVQRISQPSRVRRRTSPSAEPMKPAAKSGLARGADGEPGDRGGGGEDDEEHRPARPPRRLEVASEEGRRRHGPGTGDRHQGEDGGDEQPVGGAGEQRRPVEREPRRHRQGVARDRDDHGRNQRSGGETGQGRGQRDQADLGEVGEEQGPAGRAEQLQGGDAGALAVQIGSDPVADSDPGDDQGGEADQGEELAEPLDEAPGARGAVGAVLHLPAGRRRSSS